MHLFRERAAESKSPPPLMLRQRNISADKATGKVSVSQDASASSPQQQRRQSGPYHGGLGRLLAADEALSYKLYFGRNKLARGVCMILELSGHGLIWIAAVLFLLYIRPEEESFVWANIFMGLMLDIVVIGVMKATFRRPRPHYDSIGTYLVLFFSLHAHALYHALSLYYTHTFYLSLYI